ncbi:unnamed protein product [Phytophthora fragariaefolia]|uniref:Unnamed protein product n=1 Tax=Phytophthora fragariaefolia TaxID=1490495 RepID=A0A9W6YQV4_9STRA|nr:unnamed protein product [Phytophthora fragariaefolia]
MFVGPQLTADQAVEVLEQVWRLSQGNKKRFLKIMKTLMKLHCFRLRDAAAVVDPSRRFDEMVADATARLKYRFTVAQLYQLASVLGLPREGVRTDAGDNVPRVEALAMVCRRLSEAAKLYTVATEFGRSTAAYSRIVAATVALLYNNHEDVLYFNETLITSRIGAYCEAIRNAGAALKSCWGFIDGTKQYISRPSARENGCIPNENLQRSVYNGHPRKHCFNWQSIQTPDGIIVSMIGPVEGRKHDSTMLNISGVLDVMAENQDGAFSNRVIYGDPAYGCSTFVCSPSSANSNTSTIFNKDMSSVRGSVEWGFGRVKTLWEFMNWDKKQRVRQSAVGLNFYVAVLLFNCHTCLQPLGNQISMYFGLAPPSLECFLGLN